MWDYADWSKETKANGGPAEFADKLYQTGFQDGTIEGFSSGQRSTLGAIGIIGGVCFICGGLVVSRPSQGKETYIQRDYRCKATIYSGLRNKRIRNSTERFPD